MWSALLQRWVLLKRLHCLCDGEDWASHSSTVWAYGQIIGRICKITVMLCLVVHVQDTATLLSWVGIVTSNLV